MKKNNLKQKKKENKSNYFYVSYEMHQIMSIHIGSLWPMACEATKPAQLVFMRRNGKHADGGDGSE